MDKVSKRKNTKILDSLKCLKTNLCVFVNKDPNYDYISYEQNVEEARNQGAKLIPKANGENGDKKCQSIDDLEQYVSLRSHAQSRSRFPIYHTNYEQQSISVSSNEPVWHSTQLDDNSTQHSTKPQMQVTNIEDMSNTAFHTDLPDEDTLNDDVFDERERQRGQISYPMSPPSSIPNSCDSASDSDCSMSSSKQLLIADMETIFACCIDYEAKHEGDISVKISDRVHILYDPGTEYVLVKHVRSQTCGYIPRICILNVNKFLADLN